jgi:hypothetical protein
VRGIQWNQGENDWMIKCNNIKERVNDWLNTCLLYQLIQIKCNVMIKNDQNGENRLNDEYPFVDKYYND